MAKLIIASKDAQFAKFVLERDNYEYTATDSGTNTMFHIECSDDLLEEIQEDIDCQLLGN